MRIIKVSLYFLSLLLLTSNLFASGLVNGTYWGKLGYLDGKSYPMISSFKVNNEGFVWGKYKFNYEEKTLEGVFFDGKISGKNLKIYWQDDAGKGWLDVTFDEKFDSFEGTWGVKDSEGYWSGKK